jgi:hypothetical protein
MKNVKLYLLNEGQESSVLKNIESNVCHSNCKNEAINIEEFSTKIMDMFDSVGVSESL